MSQNQTRRRALSIIGGAGVAMVAGCLGGDDESESGDDHDDEMDDHEDEMAGDEAGVRVAHLSPDAPNVDVYIDGDAVLEDVPYLDVSDSLDLESGSYDVMITAAGDMDTVVYDEELEIGDGDYTIAALGELDEQNQPFEPAVLEDDLSDPGEMARVRLVHASPDAPAVDVTVGDGEVVLVEDAAFGDAAAVEVEPDDYTLEVRPATEDNDGDIVAEFPVSPDAGTIYSAFAVGYLDPEAAPDDVDAPFDLELVVDASHGDEDSEMDDDEMDDASHGDEDSEMDDDEMDDASHGDEDSETDDDEMDDDGGY